MQVSSRCQHFPPAAATRWPCLPSPPSDLAPAQPSPAQPCPAQRDALLLTCTAEADCLLSLFPGELRPEACCSRNCRATWRACKTGRVSVPELRCGLQDRAVGPWDPGFRESVG